MKHLSVIFRSTRTPFSVAIRGLTWSRWSHAGILVGDQVIHADAFRGVVIDPLSKFLEHASQHEIVDFAVQDPDAAIKSALNELGKPYDYTAIFGFLVHRDWQENDSWFCSELVAYALNKSGTLFFRPERRGRITPEHLWMIEPTRYLPAI